VFATDLAVFGTEPGAGDPLLHHLGRGSYGDRRSPARSSATSGRGS
jgi:hypothetical protein